MPARWRPRTTGTARCKSRRSRRRCRRATSAWRTIVTCRAAETAAARISRRLVPVAERIFRGRDVDAGARNNVAEEFPGVVAGEVRHRDDLTLFPQQPVRKARNVAHVDAGTNYPAAFAHRLEGGRDKRA